MASARTEYESLGDLLEVQKELRALIPEGSTVYVKKVGVKGRSKIFDLLIIDQNKIRSITREVAYFLNLAVRPYTLQSSIGGGIIGDIYDMDGEYIIKSLCASLHNDYSSRPSIKLEVLT